MENNVLKTTNPVQNNIADFKEYNDYQLNWKDDGDELMDPSTNDYLKGYNIDPYEFKQWASSKHKTKFASMMKKGSGEVFVMQFSPEFLADRILTLWNGEDGPLQNFFEAFTLRYNNALKQQIASILAQQGYIVYPLLIDDKPRYAKIKKLMSKVAASNDLDTIMMFTSLASKSDKLNLYTGELLDLKEAGHNINLIEANSILDYYRACFPEDYAIKLVSGLMNNQPQDINFERFEDSDWDFSDESLQQIEDYMSGNADPQYTRTNTNNGWDFTSDMRSFDGTAPGRYEISASKRLKKNSILEIPLSIATDALTVASRNVSNLLDRTLEVPPIKIKTIQPPKYDNELALVAPVYPYRVQTIYEIWKLYLNTLYDEQNEAYVLISANYTQNGYNDGKWSDIGYNGFYTTLAEAENEIYGYIER